MQHLLILIAVYIKHRSQIQYQNNINLDMFEILITHCIVKVFLFIEMRKKKRFLFICRYSYWDSVKMSFNFAYKTFLAIDIPKQSHTFQEFLSFIENND